MKQTIYEKLKSRYPEPLHGFEDAVSQQLKERAEKISDYIVDRRDRLNKKCENCGIKSAKGSYVEIVHNEISYGKTKGREHYFCSNECAENINEWAYTCDNCSIQYDNDCLCWEDNPNNSVLICPTCKTDSILNHGMSYDDIDAFEDYILTALRQGAQINSEFTFLKILHLPDGSDTETQLSKKFKLKDGEFIIIPVRNKNRDKYKVYIKNSVLNIKKMDFEFTLTCLF